MKITPESLDEKKRAILSAAQRVFDASGYAATTMELVADEAKISKGSIYNYFASKHDLFTQVFWRLMSEDEAEFAGQMNALAKASAKIGGMLDVWFSKLGQYVKTGRLILEFWAVGAREQREGQISATLGELYQTRREWLVAVIGQGVADGEFVLTTDAVAVASIIMAVVDGITLQVIFNIGIAMDDSFLAALKRAILDGLKGPSAPARKHEGRRK
jgi:AcrR family transcriptional regulator